MRRGVWIGILSLVVLAGAVACSPANGADAASSAPSPTVRTAAAVTVPGPATRTVSVAPTTVVTTPTDPTLVAPPPSTSEPAAVAGDCPYLTTTQVKDANGQNVGAVQIVATEPYPVCIFHRPDGTVLAAVRIVVADTPAAAAAAVNQHVPIDESFPATHPAGWEGGAMGNLAGVDGYPDGRSIYAVSKGTTAVIAVSNQKQSIKGRQMVTDVVANLGL